jgi:hypothetical protein
MGTKAPEVVGGAPYFAVARCNPWLRPGQVGVVVHSVRCSLLAVVLAGSGGVSAGSIAHAEGLPAPRHIAVRLTASGVQAPDSVAAGRYRIQVRLPRRSPGLLVLVKPDRGYTRADLRADDRRGGAAANRRIRTNLRFFGGVETRGGGTGTLWETLYAGRYWLVGISAERPRGFSVKTVHVHGSPFASSFPRVSGTVTSDDQGLRVSRRIPQTGRMLVRNESRRLDAQFLVPLRRGATYAEFLRAARRPRGDVPIRFRGFRTTAPLSPDAGYVLRYRLRPGTYVVMGSRGINALFNSSDAPLRRLIRPVTVRPDRRVARRGATPTASRSGAGFGPLSALTDASQPRWPAWAVR